MSKMIVRSLLGVQKLAVARGSVCPLCTYTAGQLAWSGAVLKLGGRHKE